MVFYNSQELE